MKRLIPMFLALTLMLTAVNFCSASANEDEISPSWVTIVTCDATLRYNSKAKTGTATIEVTGDGSIVKLEADVTLFHKVGNTWYEIEFWDYTTKGNSISKSETFDAEAGESYKLVLDAKAYTSSSSEPASKVVTKTF